MIGTAIEWYDYGLLGFLAPIFAQQFFPSNNTLASSLKIFMVFAIGYFLRPLGGLLFGSIADRYGRIVSLRATILIISMSSFLIGCLPTYRQINLLSPCLLIFLRLCQGISVGGEFAGSMVYVAEIAPANKRTLFSGLTNNASNFGILIGTAFCGLLMHFMSEQQFAQFGWRIPFWIGGLFGFIGYRMRRIFLESESFLTLQAKHQTEKQPVLMVFLQHKMQLFIGILLCCMGACSIYTLFIYIDTYLHLILHYSIHDALMLETTLLFLSLFFVPIASLVSNRFGTLRLLKIAACGNIFCAILIFSLLPAQHIILVGMLLLPLMIFVSIEQGIMPVTLAGFFPTAIRYSAMSISYNIAYAYIGGTAPLYNTWLIGKTHSILVPGICITVFSTVTLIAICCVERAKIPNHFVTTAPTL